MVVRVASDHGGRGGGHDDRGDVGRDDRDRECRRSDRGRGEGLCFSATIVAVTMGAVAVDATIVTMVVTVTVVTMAAALCFETFFEHFSMVGKRLFFRKKGTQAPVRRASAAP